MATTEGDGGSDDDDEADTPLHELLTNSRLRPVKPTAASASAGASGGVYTDNSGTVSGVGAMPGKGGGDLSTKPVTDYVI